MALVAISYSNTFHSPFLFDDIDFVVGNKLLAIKSLSPASLWDAGFGNGINKSRWLANISFALNHYFTGNSKVGFHATNLALHLLTTLVMYELSVTTLRLPRLGYGRSQAMMIGFLAAGLWGANPLQTNAVTYIYQRMTSMATLFFLASLLCYVRARMAQRQQRPLFIAACCLFGFLALGCKEISAILPLAILAYELYFLRDPKQGLLGKKTLIIAALLVILPLLLALATTGGQFFSWLTKEYSRYPFTMGERLLTEPRIVFFYLSLFLLPLPSRLNLLHDFSLSHGLADPLSTLVAILGLGGLIAVGVLSFRRHRLLSFAIFWYLANLVIESSFIALDLIFEHRAYLPTVFLSLLLATALWQLLRAKSLPFLITAIVCVVTLSGLTWQRNQAFATAVSFWSDVAKKSPNLANGHQGLYSALKAEGRTQEGRASLLKAFAVDPTHPQTAYDLAILYRDEGQARKAIEVLNQSLPPTPSLQEQPLISSFILNNIELRANLALAAENYADAKRDYQIYLRFSDTNPDTLINLSIAQRETGEPQQAIASLQKLPEVMKKSAIYYVNLGQAYAKDEQQDKAIEAYQQGIKLDPEYSELPFNLGLAYLKKGMKTEGEQAMRRGILLRTQPRKAPVDPHAFLK